MRRFKVRDLLITPVGYEGLLEGGPCKSGPLTDFQCAKGVPNVPDTEFPCRTDANPETSKVCAANSDTTVDCADDTYLPCMKNDNTVAHCYDKDKTRFRCLYDPAPKKDTQGVCKGGSKTTTPGWPDDPWHGCYKDPSSKRPCSDDSNSDFPCYVPSKTVRSCRIDAPEGQETQQPCYRNRAPETYTPCFEPSRFPCSEKDATEAACPRGTHTNCRVGNELTYCAGGEDKNTCIQGSHTGRFFSAAGDPRYAELADGTLPCVLVSETMTPCGNSETTGPGVLGCPPLSPLNLPADSPLTVDTLAILRADLREALRLVEGRQREINASLAPRTLKDAEALETALEAALAELRTLKHQLPRGRSGGTKKKAASRGKKPRRR